MKRVRLLTIFLALSLVACASRISPSRDWSATSLNHVVVPTEWTDQDNGAENGESAKVRRQTYSLTDDGRFTFHRSVQIEIGYLNIKVKDLDEKRAEKLQLKPFSGVLVDRVGIPTASSGLQEGDIVESFAGEKVRSAAQFNHMFRNARPGDRVELQVRRGNSPPEALTVEVSAETRIENAEGFQTQLNVLDDLARSGLIFVELTDETRRLVVGPHVKEGGLLVIEVLPGGPGFYGAIFVRDYLLSVGEFKVSSIADYALAVESLEPGDDVVYTILRDGRHVGTEVELDEDATRRSGFDIFLIDYHQDAERTELSLISPILFDCERRRYIHEDHGKKTYTSKGEWSMALSLIHYEGSPYKKTLRLGWIIPLTFYRSSD